MIEPRLPASLRPAVVAALVAGLFGVVVAAAVSLFVWLGPRNGSPMDALTLGLGVWVFLHGSGLRSGGLTIDFVPLGGTLLVGLTLYYVARKVAVDPIVNAVGFGAVAAVLYGVFVAVVARLNPYDAVTLGTGRAVLGAVVVAFVACTLGAAAEHGVGAAWWESVDARVRAAVRGARATLVALLGVSFVLVLVLLLAHRNTAGDLWTSLDPGFSGGVAVALLCLGVVPNLMLWSLAVLLGPGFALGTQTAVTLDAAQLGAIPGLPILAAVPAGGAFSGWVFALAALPVAAGILGGFLGAGAERLPRLGDTVATGALGGAAAGLVLGALLAVSGGSVGPGRMSETGPPVILSLVTAVAILTVGGALGALLGHYRGARAAADV